jgi:hypothetical protein
MTVPVGAVAGVAFSAILQIEKAHPLLARLGGPLPLIGS